MKTLLNQTVVRRPAAAAQAPELDPAPRLGARRVVRLAGAALVAVAAVAAWRWAVTTPGFAVRRIVVEGTSHADVLQLATASGALGVNTFQVDLDAVRRRLLENPWLLDARVRRVLPHDLRVDVVERVPACVREMDGTRALVDGRGRVIEDHLAPGRFPLPAIVGLDRVAPADKRARTELAAASLDAIRDMSPRLYRRARRLDASEPDHLVLQAEGLPPIWITGPESADEVAAYACRTETLRGALGELEYVDARWRDRLFVKPMAGGHGAG